MNGNELIKKIADDVISCYSVNNYCEELLLALKQEIRRNRKSASIIICIDNPSDRKVAELVVTTLESLGYHSEVILNPHLGFNELGVNIELK